MIHLGDIKNMKGETTPIVDVVTGGSPCQDLSVAGKRAGMAGERSGLFIEQIRLIKEMREYDRTTNRRTGIFIRPRFMVWENVPGAFSSNNGEDFRAVLEETAKIADQNAVIPRPAGRWSKAGCVLGDGWSIAWRVHDAQFWGVPQRRRRISVVCDFGGLSAPEILFERKGLSGDFDPGGTQGEEATGGAGKGVESSGEPLCFEPRSQDGCARIHLGGVTPTLNTAQGGQRQPCVMCIGNGQANQSIDDKAWALNCIHDQQAVMCYGLEPGAAHRLNPEGRIAKELWPTLRANAGDNQVSVSTGSVVRRLTPLECERLQGYPDGWTDIGEWVDSKGKRHKDADSPRYKALGNSIALPFWFWLLRRISAQYERPATLGSLFDGIGGFPLCWERYNGKGTAIWASEIEEFPIAVTRYHFPE